MGTLPRTAGQSPGLESIHYMPWLQASVAVKNATQSKDDDLGSEWQVPMPLSLLNFENDDKGHSSMMIIIYICPLPGRILCLPKVDLLPSISRGLQTV